MLAGTAPLILGTLSAHLSIGEAAALGLEISGDPAVLERLLPEPAARPS